MGKVVFEKCCFCVDLRDGSLIIAYLNLIASAIATIMSIIAVAGGAVLYLSADLDEQTIGAAILAIGIITFLFIAMLLGFTIVLLTGLHKHKPGHVNAFIVYYSVFLLISCLLLYVNLMVGPYDIGVISCRVIGLLAGIYFVLVIRSYYYQMLKNSTRPPQLNSENQ